MRSAELEAPYLVGWKLAVCSAGARDLAEGGEGPCSCGRGYAVVESKADFEMLVTTTACSAPRRNGTGIIDVRLKRLSVIFSTF